jgi:hypothetical protein
MYWSFTNNQKQTKRTIAPNLIIAVEIDRTRNRLFRPGIYGWDELQLPKAWILPRDGEAVIFIALLRQSLRDGSQR